MNLEMILFYSVATALLCLIHISVAVIEHLGVSQKKLWQLNTMRRATITSIFVVSLIYIYPLVAVVLT